MSKEKRQLSQDELNKIEKRKQATKEKRLAKKEENLEAVSNLKLGLQYFRANNPFSSFFMTDAEFIRIDFAVEVLYGNIFGVAVALRSKEDKYNDKFIKSLLGHRLLTFGERYHKDKTDGWYFEIPIPKSINLTKHCDTIRVQSLAYVKAAIVQLAFQGQLPSPIHKYICAESR